jgi:two-component system, cell cycle sensor histidine kinase and response regulator CckA
MTHGYRLQDLIDIEQFQAIQNRLDEIYSFPSAIIDNDGNILTATAWQDICTKFHRQDPHCREECVKSDRYILSHISSANPAVTYRCPHGLVDNATPIIIDGRHLGNFFTGQFFLEPPDLDFFRAQAKKYGFDEETYLEAVRKVPIWDEKKLNSYLFFIKGLIEIIAGIGLKNIKAIEAAKKVEDAETLFRAMFETASVGIALSDPQTGRFLGVNPRMCAVTGYSAAELQSLSLRDITHPEDRARDWHLFERMVSGEFPEYHVEKRYIRKDGSVTWVNVNATIIRDPEGKPLRTMAAIEEITGRKKAEQLLRDSEERFAAFMSHLPAAAFVKDTRGRTLFANSYLEKLMGFENWEGKTTSALIEGELGQKMEEADRRVLTEGQIELQESMTGSDGIMRTFQTIKFPIRISESKTLIGGIAMDITERRRVEQALRESTHQYETVNKCCPDTIWAMDLSGRYTYVNPSVERTHGYTVEEFLGLRYRDLVTPQQAEKDSKAFHEEMAAAESPDYDRGRIIWLESEERRKDGSIFWAEIRASFVWSDDGRPAGFIGITRDISERRKALAEKEKLWEQLAQAQKMESIGRLAGGIAHDFNNLLTAINGYSELALAQLKEGDPLRYQIEEISHAGNRAAGLTQQLLAFSRKQVLQPRVLDFNKVVVDMQSMLRRLVGEDVEVTFKLGARRLAVHADLHQLEQVIMNLAVNARDAMPEGGSLLIETSALDAMDTRSADSPEQIAGPCAVLLVRDTGVGMDEATRQKIFEPFFTTKKSGQGTGLGLSMVQGIVAQSGGCLGVESAPGAGATFRVYLPLLRDARAESDERPPVQPLKGSGTILVVEDEAEVRNLTRSALKHFGFKVVEAANAGEAIIICEDLSQPIDLVLTDVIMPHTSGPDLATRLEKIRPGIKVLFMSGYTADAVLYHRIQDKGAPFIQKPFKPRDLAEKVRKVLDS